MIYFWVKKCSLYGSGHGNKPLSSRWISVMIHLICCWFLGSFLLPLFGSNLVTEISKTFWLLIYKFSSLVNICITSWRNFQSISQAANNDKYCETMFEFQNLTLLCNVWLLNEELVEILQHLYSFGQIKNRKYFSHKGNYLLT